MAERARPFGIRGTLLQTRVGRRLLLLFVVAALLPVGILAAISYASVAGSLQEQGRERMRVTARSVGTELLEQVIDLSDQLAATSPADPDSTDAFSSLWVVSPPARPRTLFGTPVAQPPLHERQLTHLADGGIVIVVTDDRGPVVLMARRVDTATSARGVLWARVADDVFPRLLTGEGAAAAESRLCIAQLDALAIYCPGDANRLRDGQFAPALLSEQAVGWFSWTGREPYLGGFWSIFLDYRFRAPDWRVIYSEPEAAVLAPLANFRRAFPLTALLAILVVAFLSTIQIRRILEPLAALTAGTERIGRREFDQDVQVAGNDEFSDLGRAFNTMGSRLKTQFVEATSLQIALQRSATEVRQREERLSAIFESAADAVVTVDQFGRVESFNGTAEKVFGYPRDAIRGHALAELFTMPPGTGPGGLPVIAVGVGTPTLQVPGRRRDGSAFAAELAVSSAEVAGRQIFTVLVRDISERKRYEEERELLEAQLRQAQKMETIGTLAGGIAHDFNNILTPIIGNVELAMEATTADPQVTTDLEQARTAALRAKDLVRQILLFSRRSEPQTTILELGPLIKESLKFLRASFPATIEIRSEIGSALPAVLGDPIQLQQVFMNLCTNALHAMREGGGRLSVTLERSAVDSRIKALQARLDVDHALRLVVSDTGHGMSSETLERLYEPFFTTKPAGEGTGLGMSIVHGIVTNHGGAIAVASELGKGTRFDIYLPPAEQPAAAAGPRPDRSRLRGEGRILVVDDDAAIASLVSRILTRFGYHVTATTEPLEALSALTGDAPLPDLVITDQTMPGMTGTQLAARLKGARPGLRVILMTGYSELQAGEHLEALGLREVLIKPVDIELLATTVARVLDSPAADVVGAADG